MSVDISVSITEDVVDIIATPTVNIVNVTNSASIDPGLYDLSEFTNTSPNPFVRASGLSSYVPTSRTLTINGVTQDLSANRTFTISTGITIGSTAIASGVVGRVLFEGAGNVVQESSSLFWDATNNRLGIGTSTPTNDVSIYGDTNGVVRTRIENISTGTSASADIYIRNSVGGAAFQVIGTGNTVPSVTPNQVRLRADASVTNGFYIATGGANPIRLATNDTERLQINGSTGNVLIGTTTDAGFRLDVNGTARVQNTLTVTKGASNFFTFDAGANGSDLAIRFFKSGQIDVSLSSRNQVNIGAQQISFGLGLNGGFVATRLGVDSGVIAVGNTAGDSLCHIASSSGFSSYVSFRENGVSERGLLGFQNGTSYLQIRTNGATNMSNGTFSTAFFSTGNVGINTTTDAGFRLDVNGTARVSGLLSLTDNNGIQFTTGFGNNAGNMISSQGSSTLLVMNRGSRVLKFWNGSGTATSQSIQIGFGIDALEPSNLASAIVQIDSTTKGFLPPRMTQAQRNAIASPAIGLEIYQTDATEGKYIYKSSGWTYIG